MTRVRKIGCTLGPADRSLALANAWLSLNRFLRNSCVLEIGCFLSFAALMQIPPSPHAASDLVTAFERDAGLRLLWLRETRFDMTDAYAQMPKPPLAWLALFRRE